MSTWYIELIAEFYKLVLRSRKIYEKLFMCECKSYYYSVFIYFNHLRSLLASTNKVVPDYDNFKREIVSFKLLAQWTETRAFFINYEKIFLILPQERFDSCAANRTGGISQTKNKEKTAVFYDCLPRKGCLPGSYEFFRCQWERRDGSNLAAKGEKRNSAKFISIYPRLPL